MTTLGQLVANMFWDKVHTAKHSNKNQTEQLRHIWDCWLQTRFGTKLTQQITATQITHNYWDTIGTVGCKHVLWDKVHTTKHSNKHTNNHWDNIGTVGCKHVLGQILHNNTQQHKSNKSSGMHLGQLVANTFWDNIFRQGPKPAIPTNLQPTMATVYRQSSYGRESRAKII